MANAIATYRRQPADNGVGERRDLTMHENSQESLNNSIASDTSDPQTRFSLSDSSSSSSSNEADPLHCLHCDFHCFVHAEMTQHRWEKHPLLMRRKQHLMTSSIINRRRQQSETLSGVTVDSEDSSDPEQRPTLTGHKKFTTLCQNRQKTRSLDDLSTIRNTEIETRAQETSNYAFHISNVDKKPEEQMLTVCHNERRCPEENINGWSPQGCSPDLHTLADTALSTPDASRSFTVAPAATGVSSKHTKSLSDQSQLCSIRGTFGPRDKLSQSVVATRSAIDHMHDLDLRNLNLHDQRYLMQPNLQQCVVGNQNTMLYNDLGCGFGISSPGNLFGGYIPSQHFLSSVMGFGFGYPYLQAYHPHWPQHATEPNSSAGGNSPASESVATTSNNNLSTLSDVATQILADSISSKSTLSNERAQQNTRPTSDIKPLGFSTTCQPRNVEKQLKNGISNPLPSIVITSTNISHGEMTTTDKSSLANKSSFPSVVFNHSQTASNLSRHPMAKSAMADDRLRSLEKALRDTDCCDPNERSSVLPIRGSDGKWNMVRTKRIGGAWLVQLPGNTKPSVFLPKNGEKESEVKHELLSKLSSVSPSLHDLVRKSNYSMPVATSGQVCKRLKPDDCMNHQKRARLENAFDKLPERNPPALSNDAIKSLLLQKTAIA
uniref:Zinc finger protein n=1 Tax=Ciona intestinalis TaxID=7719 RepID=Q1RQ10_CIOIN|nr:zinc finger protein [Ciona intestinalis]BAE93275.1 zinc finger protein [Ciona intestinalis]|eukprot:NP_001071976.1 zinc finger protein [Ciona intestinalis]